MNKRFIYLILFLLTGTFFSLAQDPVMKTMKSELNRNFEVLKEQDISTYYINLRLDESQSLSAVARLGRLQSPAIMASPDRVVTALMRVGDYQFDNSHEIRGSGYGSYSNLQVFGQYIPFEDNESILKKTIWLTLDELYKENIQVYEQVKANMAVKVEQEDKSPDFSQEPVENYYEPAISWESLGVSPKLLEEKVRLYSAVFNENSDVLDAYAYFGVDLARTSFIDTEGREIAQNSATVHLALSAETMADDGMYLPLQKTWFAYKIDELPSDEEVIAAAREMSNMISQLKKAPVVESFTGPAILSPEATGVFFHEIFGHRIEGSRLKQESDAQTFKKKIGERVLPKHISVTFDPNEKYFGKTPLAGYYVYDDEGIRSQKVEVVQKGILRDFLMARTPIEGHERSNGHGRGNVGYAPVSRQSNMFVNSTEKLSQEDLFKSLRKEAKKQGKEYAYYFHEVSGGFTNTNRYSANSFNVTPVIVYRVYVDGRPNELVRGVDLVGTPLAMFSQIQHCGADYSVFNGTCGAESGQIPVACIAPALMVKHIETQKRAKNQSQPPLLPKPKADELKTALDSEDIVARSIRNEVDRALENLKMDGLQAPFFIAYTLNEVKSMTVTASQGSLFISDYGTRRNTGSRLLIGDYVCSDENYQGNASSAGGFDGTPCLDNDEEGLRYTIWRDLDAIYKRAAETYEQKLATIKQLDIPAEDLELPDWDKTPVVVMNELPRKNVKFDKEYLNEYVKEASKVYNSYSDILQSDVSVTVYEALIYFYNTEGTEFRYPIAFTSLSSSASGKTIEGEDLNSSIYHVFSLPEELPSLDELKVMCTNLAKQQTELISAPKINKAYTGPVLFEDLAAVTAIYGNLIQGENISLIASRKPLTSNGFSYGGNPMEDKIDTRVIAKEISIEDLTGTPEYKGKKLFGYAPIDGQGVIPPQRLSLIENGVLKTLLSDRVPTPAVPHSNGHALLGPMGTSGVSTGVVRVTDTRIKSKDELKAELIKRAKEEGYEYAYIVRESSNGGSYPVLLYQVNVNDGSEKRIRSAYISDLSDKSFKDIIGVDKEEFIYNTIAGNPTTLIVPRAILFEELQLQSDRVDNFRKPPIVPRY